MRNRLAILVTLVAAVIACQDRSIAQMAAIKRDVCECKTASCAEQAMKRVPGETIKSSPRTQALARDLIECLSKLQASERPSTDPDAEGSAAAPAAGSAAPAPAPAPATTR
ncbi:MAG TPA: hypothetical protein VGD37_33100 [Kofleriaceae bacterium]